MGKRALTVAPLTYQLRMFEDMTLLAHDPSGTGRIVEVLGDLEAAERIAVVVPGNAHDLGNYRSEMGGAAPRVNGRELYRTLLRLAPETTTAVIVWLGYTCPRGFLAAARRRPAAEGAEDLRRMTYQLPGAAPITLVGHSYGSVVCALAAGGMRVSDVVALASPGLGVRNAGEVGARVWATRASDDWIRFFPRGRIAGFGHGRQPTDPGFGATVFSSTGASSHSNYYAPGTESVRNIARIVAGRHDEVTRSGSRDLGRRRIGTVVRRA